MGSEKTSGVFFPADLVVNLEVEQRSYSRTPTAHDGSSNRIRSMWTLSCDEYLVKQDPLSFGFHVGFFPLNQRLRAQALALPMVEKMPMMSSPSQLVQRVRTKTYGCVTVT